MDEEELDKAVEEYRSHKRCIGTCDQVLPNTDEYFQTDIRRDRGNRAFIRSKCRTCTIEDKLEAERQIRVETEPAPLFEMTFEEIGNELGVSKQHIQQTYERAMKKLRRLIKQGKLAA